LSPKNPLAKIIGYHLKRWPAFTRFLEDGRICMSNNAVMSQTCCAWWRTVRGIAVGLELY